MYQLLDILETCTLLEFLTMDKAEPQSCAADPTTHPAPSRSICLKHLKNLTLLFKRLVDVAFFLSHIEIPASAI